MSWLAKLFNTYNNHVKSVGIKATDERSHERFLTPIFHTVQNAHIEVTLDREGNFVKASVIPKSDGETIIPVTESSESRSGAKVAPHSLADNIGYITSIDKEKCPKNFSVYKTQLLGWLEFDHNPMITAVYDYISKDRLISDLIQSKILPADENGNMLDDKASGEYDIYKVVVGELKKAFVRFCVVGTGASEIALCNNRDVWASWIEYQEYSLSSQEKALCYASGNYEVVRQTHPKKIRNSADGAKLISSNDSSNFTYRGRFVEPKEVVNIGYSVSSKAHAALIWLISKQAYKEGGHTILAWSETETQICDPLGLSFEDTYSADTNEEYSKKLGRLLAGYKTKLNRNETVNLIALDAATSGRMSIIYYREFTPDDYLDMIFKWYDTCKWEKRIFVGEKNARKLLTIISTPSPKDIYYACYGYVIDEKLYHQLITRLLPCISESKKLPYDIVLSAVRKVSNRVAFKRKEQLQWENSLITACALIKKYYNLEDSAMALNEKNNHRDYLYGRLLAVAELLERKILDASFDGRLSNAERYFNQMSARPSRTWKIIEEALQPYISKLGSKAVFYKRILDEIMWKFDDSDFISDKPLSPEYLLGYHNQRKAIFTKNNTEE